MHKLYVQESELDSCTALRHVLVGGEALPPVLASRFGQRLPNAHLHNAYGPTETTVDATGKPLLSVSSVAVHHRTWKAASVRACFLAAIQLMRGLQSVQGDSICRL